jgi:tetratricopeptide (TPR) repeat protein
MTLMIALQLTNTAHANCGNYAKANALIDELAALADETGSVVGMMQRGVLFAVTGRAADAVQTITSGLNALLATGQTFGRPTYLSHLARAHAELGRIDDALRCIDEAITAVETTKEKRFEAGVYRVAGEIALMAPKPDAAKAQACFKRALTVARQQQLRWRSRRGGPIVWVACSRRHAICPET